jgi:hypothetical protein
MGTTYDNIVINDMVVNQPAQQIFLSVERGRGTNVIPAIVKVNRGQLEVLKLAGIPHSKVEVPNEPDSSTPPFTAEVPLARPPPNTYSMPPTVIPVVLP